MLFPIWHCEKKPICLLISTLHRVPRKSTFHVTPPFTGHSSRGNHKTHISENFAVHLFTELSSINPIQLCSQLASISHIIVPLPLGVRCYVGKERRSQQFHWRTPTCIHVRRLFLQCTPVPNVVKFVCAYFDAVCFAVLKLPRNVNVRKFPNIGSELITWSNQTRITSQMPWFHISKARVSACLYACACTFVQVLLLDAFDRSGRVAGRK